MIRILITVGFLWLSTASFCQLKWDAQTSGTTENLNDATFVTNKTGWITGNNGVILHTNDGGYHWNTQTSGLTNQLNSIFFLDVNIGWIAGAGGKILFTNDGGNNWLEQNSGETANLTDIIFVDEANGWVSGNGDILLHTSDSGNTWTPQTPGYSISANTVFFIDTSTGWAAGDNSSVIKTVNGGTSWTVKYLGGGLPLYDIFFINDSTGWTVGGDGATALIYKTSDGGANWTAQTAGISIGLYGVHFIDTATGWAAGLSGKIIHTTDGGASWQESEINTTENLNSIHFTGEFTGWAVGNTGTIQKKSWTEEICMVTVDSLTQKNKIIWERIFGQGTAYYKIYKLIGAEYDSIATVLFDDMSEYIDYSSTPSSHFDLYKISAVDSFGNESALSPYHKTINLQVNQGVPSTTINLAWNLYEEESGTFIPEYHYIYRGTTPTDLSLYQTLSSANDSYDDIGITTPYYYQIAVNKEIPCVPTSSGKASNGPYSQSLSNMEDNGLFGNIDNPTPDNLISIFPNPASEIIHVSMLHKSDYVISIYDVRDVKLKSFTLEQNNSFEMNVSDFSPGFYRIEIKGKNCRREKLIIR